MKAMTSLFLGAILLSGTAIAAGAISDTDRDRARAWTRCDNMTGDARAQCFKDARLADNRNDYWSAENMGKRAKARTQSAAAAAGDAAHKVGDAAQGNDVTAKQDRARHGKEGYWTPERMAERAKNRVKRGANAVENAVEGKQDASASTIAK